MSDFDSTAGSGLQCAALFGSSFIRSAAWGTSICGQSLVEAYDQISGASRGREKVAQGATAAWTAPTLESQQNPAQTESASPYASGGKPRKIGQELDLGLEASADCRSACSHKPSSDLGEIESKDMEDRCG